VIAEFIQRMLSGGRAYPAESVGARCRDAVGRASRVDLVHRGEAPVAGRPAGLARLLVVIYAIFAIAATVWSNFGLGYLLIPLALPIIGLWWLRRTSGAAPSPIDGPAQEA
jgi:hypothetical protein